MKFLLIYVPTLRFAGYIDNYRTCKLIDISEIITRTNENNSEYPIMMISAGKGFIAQSEKYSRDNAGTSINKYILLKKGELAYNRGNSKQFPYGAIYEMKEEYALIPYVYHCFNIYNGSTRYFSYYLNSPFKDEQLSKIITSSVRGNGLLNISKKDFFNLSLNVPSIKEQNKIADFLDLIENRIQTQIKIINALDSQRRCLFLKAHRAFSLKKVKIAELGRMVAVNNLSKDELSIEGYDCILYGELFTKYNLYVDNVVSKTEKMDNAIVSGGNELLFPTSTTVDAISLIKPVALIKKGVILGGDMFSIKLKDSYNPIYISCLINFIYRRKFASKTQGSTIIHLHYRDIKNEIIEICDYEVQCKIAHLIESITEKIKVEEELLNLLYLQKSYLLQNMFI